MLQLAAIGRAVLRPRATRCLCSSAGEGAADKILALARANPGALVAALAKEPALWRGSEADALAALAEADENRDGHVTTEEVSRSLWTDWCHTVLHQIIFVRNVTRPHMLRDTVCFHSSPSQFVSWYRRRVPPAVDGSEDASGESFAAAPSSLQLRRLAVKSFVPFVGFGFLDNAIMILAGDQIDATFGATLGLSAMAAAGLGNLCSDVAGVQAGGIIERFATKLGLPDHGMNAEQQQTPVAQRVLMAASALGIAIGCLLGMAPLLMMEDAKTRGLREIFKSIDVRLPRACRAPCDTLMRYAHAIRSCDTLMRYAHAIRSCNTLSDTLM